ncbi:MAG TPA: hypothetical protein VM345_01915 [Acidimicrobiales bacterium]|nr:hypothetical protein [Acidimicrobiales bacterium]
MPEVIAEALVGLRADMNDQQARREIEQSVRNAERQIRPVDVPVDTRRASAQIAELGGLMKGLLGAAAVQQGLRLVGDFSDATRDLVEAQSAANFQFESGARLIEEYADRADRSAGLSRRAATEMTTTFGAFFDQLGIGGEQAAKLSLGLTQLSGDLASFRNLNVEDAAQKIAAGLAGETEPLRRVGVFLNEASVQAKAAELGLGAMHGELTDGEKVLARYHLILEGLAKAQGNFAATSDELANTQRAQQAAWENLKAILGEQVNPTLISVQQALTGLTGSTAAAGDRVGWFGNAFRTAYEFMVPGIGALQRLGASGRDAADASGVMADAQRAAADAVQSMTLNVEAQIEALRRQVDAVYDAVDADLARRQTALAVEDAQLRVEQAQRDLNDAMSGGGRFAEQAARAQERLADAHSDVARAQERVKRLTWDLSDAQEALAEAVFHYGAGSRQARDAARDVERTQADLEQANTDSAKAARDLARAQDEATRAATRSEAIADASRRLERARIDLEAAVFRAVKAESAFADASNTTATKQEREREAVTRTRDALRRYSETLEGPVKAAVDARIKQLDDLIARLERTESLLGSTGLDGTVPPPVSAGALAPGAVTGGTLSGPGTIGGGQLGAGSIGAGDMLAKSVSVTFNYPVPPEQTAAYVDAVSGGRP